MATEATLLQAVNAALGDAMAHDDRTVLLGQDVGRLGGVFRATQGLLERYPDRVFDTPLAEGGIVGSSIGLALGGMVPIAEIQFLGFLHQAWHQVTQQLARYRYRTRSRYHLPVTIRAPYGGGLRMPEYHPDSIEGQLTNVPGIKVYTPAFPDDAYLMVRAAVADPDPVVVMEPQRLYRSVRGALPESVDVGASIGVRTRRVGSDVLLVSWGPAVHLCLAAADVLGDQHGVAAGVLDLRSLNPLDDEGLFAAASATPRVVVVHEGVRTSGFGAEVIARLQEALAGTLQLPVRRITAPDTPYPPGRTEDRYLPGVDDVVAAALRSCDVEAVPS